MCLAARARLRTGPARRYWWIMADQPSESPGRTARRLMRQADRASLATLYDSRDVRWPYASLVLMALDTDASPLLLISDLAEHTKNLAHDAHASLLIDATSGLAEPLTGARVTVLGEMARVPGGERTRLLARFLARHPSAEGYARFGDFDLWRLRPARAHLIAGFGRIHWIEAAEFLPPTKAAAALAAAEPGILEHMNRDHAATVDLYAKALLGLSGEGWRLSGVDPDGADLRLDAAAARLEFAAPASDADGVRREFVRLAQAARGDAAGA
jgi:heme iron utilization protein